jgi:pilus assembly protein CpaF
MNEMRLAKQSWGFKKDDNGNNGDKSSSAAAVPAEPTLPAESTATPDAKLPADTTFISQKPQAPSSPPSSGSAPSFKPTAPPPSAPAEPATKETILEKEKDHYSDLKVKIHKRLIEEIDVAKLSDNEGNELRFQIKQAVNQLLLEENELITASERERLIEDILNETMGLGPLEPLLRDRSITEIMINGPSMVFVERKGKLTETSIRFKDNAHLLQIIDRIVSAVGRRVDETQPLCDARLRDGSRFNCVIPPLALDGPLVTIRKFSKDPFKIQDLINFGSLNEQAAQLLHGFVEARLNIIISGGTGSGKTTLLNVLSSFIPGDERIVTIEDTAELQLQQRHVARMETRPPNIEGKGEITQRDLVKNALRMRPERIVLGECRSGETLDMLQAMNTGHDGSLTTLHANNPRDAIRRMETMVMMAGYDLPQKAIREQIASAVNVIIQASRLSDGSRRVMNITEIVGMEGDTILMQDIFTFVQYGLDEDRKVVGEFKYTGVRPKFLDVLIAEGVNIDMEMFKV